jgi:hypothetical protein
VVADFWAGKKSITVIVFLFAGCKTFPADAARGCRETAGGHQTIRRCDFHLSLWERPGEGDLEPAAAGRQWNGAASRNGVLFFTLHRSPFSIPDRRMSRASVPEDIAFDST